jgi:hypothetical protein
MIWIVKQVRQQARCDIKKKTPFCLTTDLLLNVLFSWLLLHLPSTFRFISYQEKVNVYLPSLRMKVPDHVYVFGSLLLQYQLTFQSVLFIVFCLLLLSNGIDVGIDHTCNTMRVYHDTIIKCATLDSFCF